MSLTKIQCKYGLEIPGLSNTINPNQYFYCYMLIGVIKININLKFKCN